ncbi:MAG: OsmC family peroxiredoxin [Opitutus sp.]|nr:OsmC family peroxiredoxin [Opitutus sp.]
MITWSHPGNTIRRVAAGALSSVGLWLAPAPRARAQPTHTAQDWSQAPANFAPQDSLRDYLGRLKSALLAVQDRPEQQQALKLTAHVVAEGRTGVRRLRIRNFQFLSDGAPATAESNLGPGSWPTVTGVLGSAVAQDFLMQAALKGVPLDELEVVFTSQPGAAPRSGGGARVVYPRDLVYTAYLVSPASDAELEELRQTVERVSPVLNLVSQAQAIEHGTLVYKSTPAKRAGKTLEGLREFLAEKQAAAAGAKPPAVPRLAVAGAPRNPGEPSLRAHVKVEAGTGIRHVRTDASNFQIIHDSPRYLAGHNLGPIAEEHLLGVMITCLTHIYEMQAASRNVVLDSLELEVEGTLVPRLGSTATPPRLKDIRYHVYIGSPESKEKIQQLQQAVEATCPIYHMLKDAQPINGSIVRGPYR